MIWKGFWWTIYALIWLVSMIGFAAPSLPVYPFAILQVSAILMLPLTFFHLFGLLFGGNKAGVRFMAITGLIACVWAGAKDIRFMKREIAPESSFRIVSYNVEAFKYKRKTMDEAAALVRKQKPDIVCLQEFRSKNLADYTANRSIVSHFADKVGLNYYAFVALPQHANGVAIFSRYPITQIDTLYMPRNEINSGILATLETPYGKVGVANVHLSSFSIMEKVINTPLSSSEKAERFYQSWQKTTLRQQKTVDKILDFLPNYKYPLVLTGDMNAPPQSWVASQFDGALSDSFLEKGNGFGWTYPIVGTVGLRIDYQFFSKELRCWQHKAVPSSVSDHYPVVATYSFRK